MSKSVLSAIKLASLSTAAIDTRGNNKEAELLYDKNTHLIRYFDGTVWQSIARSIDAIPSYAFGLTPPLNPVEGERWLDSSTGIEYTYVNDGNGNAQWVDLNPQLPGPIGQTGVAGLNPIFSKQGSLAVVLGQHRFYAERNGTVSSVRASVGTPATGSSILIDVQKNGVTILSTPISIPSGEYTALGTISSSSVTAGDYFSVNINGVGSVTTGANLTVTLAIQ